MKNKGFTLIELLAVIVILAIIALIATPIILNIISDSKEESNKRSVELYAKSIENAVAAYQLREGKEVEVGAYSSEDGKTLTKGYTTLKVEYNGNVVCTTVNITETGKVTLAGCTVNGSTSTYKYGANGVEKEDTNNNEVASMICTLEDGTSKSIGSKYTCTVMDDVYFYVLENDPESEDISLIMDRNYTDATVPSTVAWCTDGGSDNTTCTNINDTYVPIIQSAFNTTGVTVSFPTKAQIESAYTGAMPTWLYDYLEGTTNSVSSVYGYWSASPRADLSVSAWFVSFGGYLLSGGRVDLTASFGVRPVITLPKSSIN